MIPKISLLGKVSGEIYQDTRSLGKANIGCVNVAMGSKQPELIQLKMVVMKQRGLRTARNRV